jgi:hypothetical protein
MTTLSQSRQQVSVLAARPGRQGVAMEGDLSTMSALDTESLAELALEHRVALVRAQLAPIHSRPALLDSYRRESLCRLGSPAGVSDSAADVLELAYAARWAELELESPATMSGQNLEWGFLDG